MPSTATFVARGVLVLLWFLLDGLPVLDALGDSKLFRRDSSRVSISVDGKRVGEAGYRSMLSSSLKYAAVPGP